MLYIYSVGNKDQSTLQNISFKNKHDLLSTPKIGRRVKYKT